jgi:hypothetical protein
MPANNVCFTVFFFVSLQIHRATKAFRGQNHQDNSLLKIGPSISHDSDLLVSPLLQLFSETIKEEMIVIPYGMTIEFPCSYLFDR